MGKLIRLNGWIRLYIFLVIVFGIIVLSVGIATLPRADPIYSAWANDIISLYARHHQPPVSMEEARYNVFQALSDSQIVRKQYQQTSKEPNSDGFVPDWVAPVDKLEAIKIKYSNSISALPSVQQQFIFNALFLWLLPSLAFLVMGYGVIWVSRGFASARRS